MDKLLKFGLPRKGELSTWIGAGGLVTVLALFLTAEQANSIEMIALGVISLLATFNKEESAE